MQQPSSDNKIAWYENDGASPPSFVEHVISTSADQAFSVLAADMDGDGDVDILSASVYDDKIAWYEDHGGRPPSFVEHVITEDPDGLFGPQEGMADWPIQVTSGDLDGDGDNDVIAASVYADHFYWYENDGGSPPQFTPRILDEMPWGQIHVHIIDTDRDGDLDIISSLGFEHQIAWFENDGALEPSFTLHQIWGGDWPPLSFFPADLDGDGDLDVVAPDVPANRTVWLESDGGTPPTFRQRSLIDYDDFHRVIAVDIDDDGDPDPVGSLFAVILWYENRVLRPHGTRGTPLPLPRELQQRPVLSESSTPGLARPVR